MDRSHEELEEIAERLATGKESEITITKTEMPIFGSIIRKRNDFLHFNGTAHKGGSVSYIYLENPRS